MKKFIEFMQQETTREVPGLGSYKRTSRQRVSVPTEAILLVYENPDGSTLAVGRGSGVVHIPVEESYVKVMEMINGEKVVPSN